MEGFSRSEVGVEMYSEAFEGGEKVEWRLKNAGHELRRSTRERCCPSSPLVALLGSRLAPPCVLKA